MIQQIISQLNLTTILLIAALIAAFIIATKVMEMIFDTALIAAVSAGFYIALRTLQGGNISINDLLLFSILGSTIYMTYNLLQSLYKVGSTVVTIPVKALKTMFKPVKYLYGKLKDKKNKDFSPKNQRKSEKQEKKDKKDPEDKSTKEVVLGSKNKEEEE